MDYQRGKYYEDFLIGNSVHVESRIESKRLTSKPGRGIITETVRLVNQRGETAAEGEHVAMIQTRPS